MSSIQQDDNNKFTNDVMNGIIVTIVVVCSLALFSAGATVIFRVLTRSVQ